MPSLSSVLDRRLLLVTGKGGTGKSAVATSLALAAGRRGKRVLALSMDGGGLARHLGRSRLDAAPVRYGDIHAAAVDPARALDEYLHLRARVPRVAAVSRIFAAVVDTVPGIRDTVMIGKVVFESTSRAWDLVVVDAPPTGQVLSFLRAPGILAGLVPGGSVREQATWLRSMLADRHHSGLVVVATPEELPVKEATDLCAEVGDGTIEVAAMVANKVLPPADFGVAIDPGPAADAAALHRALQVSQERHLAGFAADHTIPHFFGVHNPDETAARIADLWETP